MEESLKPLFNYALKLLGGRRYTAAGLKKKLAQRVKKTGVQPEDAGRVVARLTELRLLDDAEYAQLYISEQLRRKPQGIKMLRARMTAKGLPQDIIRQTLHEAEPDETTLARVAAAKKLKTLNRLPPQKRKEKLVRFLASRGFGSRAVMSALKYYHPEEDKQG